MVALIKGKNAPPVDLAGLDGKRYNLQMAASSAGAVVLVFFKVSCPTCQYTLPFVERLHQRYQSANIWGVSQDDVGATQNFVQQYKLSFPVLLDDGLGATVKYDLSTVPSIFLVDRNLSVKMASDGFVRNDLEELSRELAVVTNQPVKPFFQAADDVPALKPG